jgi:DNA-binding beta-propeller fold protein YncE
MKNKNALFLEFIFLLLILSRTTGCGSTSQQVDMSWPPPPEQPRIAFVEILQDENYFPKSTWQKIMGSLLGDDPSKRLAKPYGVVADATGTVYVTDTILSAVIVFDKQQKKIRTIGDSGPGRLAVPSGIAIADTLLYVSDSKQRRVFCYNTNGDLKLVFGQDTVFAAPAGIALDSTKSKIFVVDAGKHCVHIFSVDGKYLSSFGHRGSEDGEFNYPTNICIKNGKIYIMDTMNFRVQIFDMHGMFLSKFGSVGNRPGFFTRPKGIGIDSEGHIYISDAGFENFQLFNEKGEILMFVGNGGTKPGEFGLPAGLFIDNNDRIYIVEQSNSRVQVFKYSRSK